jgi:hypothetical protein
VKRGGPRLAGVAEVVSAPDWGRPGLSPAGRVVSRAAIEALLCDGDDELVLPDREWCDRVVASYDLSLGACSPQVRIGVAVLLVLLEWLPLFVLGVGRRMSRLSLRERVRYLEALESHPRAPLTMLLVATKIPMLMAAFEAGEPLRATGYDRPTAHSRRKLGVLP